MEELKSGMAKISKLGQAKIAGLTCNKRAGILLRLDIEVPPERLKEVVDALQLETTPELVASLQHINETFKIQ